MLIKFANATVSKIVIFQDLAAALFALGILLLANSPITTSPIISVGVGAGADIERNCAASLIGSFNNIEAAGLTIMLVRVALELREREFMANCHLIKR